MTLPPEGFEQSHSKQGERSAQNVPARAWVECLIANLDLPEIAYLLHGSRSILVWGIDDGAEVATLQDLFPHCNVAGLGDPATVADASRRFPEQRFLDAAAAPRERFDLVAHTLRDTDVDPLLSTLLACCASYCALLLPSREAVADVRDRFPDQVEDFRLLSARIAPAKRDLAVDPLMVVVYGASEYLQQRAVGPLVNPEESFQVTDSHTAALQHRLDEAALLLHARQEATLVNQALKGRLELLEQAHQQATRELATLQSTLAERDQQRDQLQALVARQAERLTIVQGEVAIRDVQLVILHQSKFGRLAQQYWHARHAALMRLAVLRRGPRATVAAIGRRIVPRPLRPAAQRLWSALLTPRRARERPRVAPQVGASPLESITTTWLPARQPAEWSGWPVTYDIICFSIIDWEMRWQRPQQTMSRFADQGHRVFYISGSRVLPESGERYRAARLRENVWEVQLAVESRFDLYGGQLSPALTEAIVADLATLRADFSISTAVSVVHIATWTDAALLARQRFGWRLVYDCMDEWDTFPLIQPPLLRAEQDLVASADLLVVSGQRLYEKWRDRNRHLVLARNAADFNHFAAFTERVMRPPGERPVVGYFGAVAEWFDLDLIARLARERPQYQILLIGGVFDLSVRHLRALPNVRLVGQQPYALMPAFLRQFDACLIPFKMNAVTEATDPVKFYEYISQGKPVVATMMPELFAYRDYLYLAETAEDFIRQVDLAVNERDPALRDRRIALARKNTWEDRLAAIKEGIAGVHPRVSIIIVTHNSGDYLLQCLESITRNTLYPNYEVIVVDNASTDDAPQLAQSLLGARDERLRVVLNQTNAGFASGNNQGLHLATGDYLVLLNPDTLVPNGWLHRLLRHLDDPAIGLVGSVTNFAGNEARIPPPHPEPDDIDRFAAEYARTHEGRSFDIAVAAMFCVALRRDTLELVGPLDERFSIGMFEDDDYAKRVRKAGLRVVCAEDSYVYHFGQGSFKQLSAAQYQAIWDRNQQRFEEKWGEAWQRHQARS